MAYWTHTQKPIGAFQEKEVGNWFEYSINDDTGVKGFLSPAKLKEMVINRPYNRRFSAAWG